MKSTIFIPKTIKVGYQNRNGTYTGSLAYVIYYDEKGKLRKETSWENWRDKNIEPNEFDNTPTEGFVLNKKVGDYVSYWSNHRQAYVRVYDSVRDFEFEITIENLLYILENASSIKGKGLSGQFIYAWDKKDLLLLPIDSPDYKQIQEYTDKLNENFKLRAKDLKIGATYLTKDNKEYTYLGRFDKWDYNYGDYDYKGKRRLLKWVNKGKHHFFYCESKYNNIETFKSLTKFISIVSEDCNENYAEMFEKLEVNTQYSPQDTSKDEYIPYTFDEFDDKFNEASWGVDFYTEEGEKIEIKRETYGISKENLKIEKKVYITKQGWSGTYQDWKWDRQLIGNVKDVFDLYKPCYLREYLQNGKLYREGK